MSLRQKGKIAKRDMILEAAARVFSRKGYSGTIISEIAAEAGIGKGTIYEYFESKEELFFAVFEWFSLRLFSAAKLRLSTLSCSASEKLEAFVESVTLAWVALEEFFSLFMEFWAASGSSQLRDRFKDEFHHAYNDMRNIVSNLIKEGIVQGEFRSDVDPESIASGIIGGLDGIGLQSWFDDQFDPRKTAKMFVGCIISGMKCG